MLKATPVTVHRARHLRREMSLPEAMLWSELRKRPGGIKARRQHPVGDYVADFFIASARLIVEIDGISHRMGQQSARDHRRDTFFRAQGLRVLRLAAQDVISDVPGAVTSILGAVALDPPLHHALNKRAVPLPRSGEDLERPSWTI